MDSYTLRLLFDFIGKQLQDYYPETEIQSVRRLIFEKLLKIRYYEAHLNPDLLVNPQDMERVQGILSELRQGRPIQYILGETDFMDLIFKVNKHVLIPRPETEELVSWIIQNNSYSTSKILDIGTGSGCIAVTLAKYLANASVYAIDISAEALQIASENAKNAEVEVTFSHADILKSLEIYGGPFDIIVSNPPYVRDTEKMAMENNVLNYEPHLALFVPDDDPLVFYRIILKNAEKWLNPNGQVYFEINEAFGNQIIDLLKQNNFSDIVLRKDISGRDRMVMGIFKGE